MFIHLSNKAQSLALADLIKFHANNREQGTKITISSHECERTDFFDGCVVFDTTQRSGHTRDRIIVAPNGETLHLT